MTDDEELRFIRERNTAFENDDHSWAAERLPPGIHDYVVLMAFHKARYGCTQISEEKRRDSQKWLAKRMLKDLTGNRVNVGDPLPE